MIRKAANLRESVLCPSGMLCCNSECGTTEDLTWSQKQCKGRESNLHDMFELAWVLLWNPKNGIIIWWHLTSGIWLSLIDLFQNMLVLNKDNNRLNIFRERDTPQRSSWIERSQDIDVITLEDMKYISTCSWSHLYSPLGHIREAYDPNYALWLV